MQETRWQGTKMPLDDRFEILIVMFLLLVSRHLARQSVKAHLIPHGAQ